MGARRGRRSVASRLARQAETHRRTVDAACLQAERLARAEERERERAARVGIRGVGIVTRGLPVPPRGKVTDAPVGQWQAMPADPPVHFSDERTLAYVRDRKRERAATRASNDLLARDREVREVEAIRDAMS